MKTSKIKKNIIFNAIYQIFAIIVPLITTPYIARTIGVSADGEYSFYVSILTYFTIFAAFGFNSYATRLIAKNRDDKYKYSKIFIEIVLCKTIFSLVAIVFYFSLLYSGVFGGVDVQNYYLILSLQLFAVIFDIGFFFQGKEEFVKIAVRNVLIKCIGIALIFTLIKSSDDLWLYILINSLIILVSNLSLWTMLFKMIQKIKLKELEFLPHFKGTLVYFIPTIATMLYTVLDKTMIGLITNDSVQNGIYEEATKLIKFTCTCVLNFNIIMLSRMSYLYEIKDEEQIKIKTQKSLSLYSIIALPAFFGFLAMNQYFIPLFLGNEFNEAISLIYVLVPLILIIPLSDLIGSIYFIPVNKRRLANIFIIIGAIMNVVLNSILIYPLGALGACISSLIAEFTILVLYIVFSRKHIDYKSFFKNIIKQLDASLIMFAFAFISSKLLSGVISLLWLNLIVISFSVFIYFGLLLLFKEQIVYENFMIIFNKVFKRRKE